MTKNKDLTVIENVNNLKVVICSSGGSVRTVSKIISQILKSDKEILVFNQNKPIQNERT